MQTALTPTSSPTAQPSPSPKAHACPNPNCTNGWLKLRRRRFTFEDGSPCSSKCLEAIIRAAVEREAGDSAAPQPQRHRVPLGLVLLAQGWITHPQLQAALSAQKASGRGRIGDWLAQGCGLEEDRITRSLGVQSGCPVLTPEGFLPEPMALVMPKRFVAELGLVPLRLSGHTLRLAFEDRLDAPLAAALRQMTGLTLETGLLKASDFASTRAALLAADAVPVRIALTQDAATLTGSITQLVERTQPAAARLVRVHRYYWLRLWLNDATYPGQLPARAQGIEDHLFMVS